MMSKNTSPTRKPKSSRAMLIGYVLFGITVLACAAWVMYRYHWINGWKYWKYITQNERFIKIITKDLPYSLGIVSLVAGVISIRPKFRTINFILCYLYLLIMAWIIPLIWSIDIYIYSLTTVLREVIIFCSIYSIVIIPCFATSAFFACIIANCFTSIERAIKNRHRERKDAKK